MNNIGTQLASIRIDDIKVNPEKYNSDRDEHVSSKLKFTTGAKSFDLNVLLARVEVIIEQDDKVLTSLILTALFNVEKKGWVTFNQKGKLIIPKFLLLRIFSIIFSTARGVILMRNYGNKLKSITLPLVDANEFVTEDHIIEIGNPQNEFVEYPFKN